MSRLDATQLLALRLQNLESVLGQTGPSNQTKLALSQSDSTRKEREKVGDKERSRSRKSVFQRTASIQKDLKENLKDEKDVLSFLNSFLLKMNRDMAVEGSPQCREANALANPHYLSSLSFPSSSAQSGTDSKHSAYLTPSFVSSNSSTTSSSSTNLLTPTSSELDPSTQFSLLLEAQSDLEELEKTLSQCKNFQERKVLEKGKLLDHFDLLPRLKEVAEGVEKEENELKRTEDRSERLLEAYGRWVDSLSQLFITWDLALNDMELRVAQEERLRDQRN